MKKLLPDQKMFVCNMLAQYKKTPEIKELAKKEHGITLSTQVICGYRNRNKELINKLRESFLQTIIEVPIAQKRVRLERAEELYDVSQELKGRDKVLTSLSCLKEAREEVEGKGAGSVTFQQFNQYNQLTDEELKDKLREVEEKIAKTNVIEAEV